MRIMWFFITLLIAGCNLPTSKNPTSKQVQGSGAIEVQIIQDFYELLKIETSIPEGDILLTKPLKITINAREAIIADWYVDGCLWISNNEKIALRPKDFETGRAYRLDVLAVSKNRPAAGSLSWIIIK